MTADKAIEILEELKKDFENKCNSSIDAGNIEALDMTITMLKRGCDLASENDELKNKLSHLTNKHNELASRYEILDGNFKTMQIDWSCTHKENETLWKVLEVLKK